MRMIRERSVFASTLRVSAGSIAVFASSAAVTVAATAFFGANRSTDAFITALAIPLSVMAITTLAPSIAAIPVLIRVGNNEGEQAYRLLARTLLWSTAGFMTIASVLVLLARDPLLYLLAPGFTESQRALT